MSTLAASRAMYLDVGPDPVFGIFHPPTGYPRSGTGVLICPPWGWDEITSYRSRRAWADELAEAGHPALRIDLPGSGDSAGSPADPGRLAAWSSAVIAAADWLRTSAGCSRVALVGLGLGGLVAGKAIDEGAAIDDLVLWATPTAGRTFLRETRAFATLQSSRYTLTGEPEPNLLPDGWLEIGGFVLSAETIQDLGQLSLTGLKLGGLQRVLLLERDGIAVDTKLHEYLTGIGLDVSVAPGPGWGAMCFHPERYAPPRQVFTRVRSWLAEAPAASRSSTTRRRESSDEMEFSVDGTRVRESAMVLDVGAGQLFGVLTVPVGQPALPLCAVFLDAGAVRRVGPNRMWVEAARRWAAMGVPSFRIDVDGIGDADGDAARFVDVGEFYTAEIGSQVQAALDALQERGIGQRFVLVGLCSGAYWAFHQAALDGRVTAAFILNARALIWDPELETRRAARGIEAVLKATSWGRILRGEVAASRVRAVGAALARGFLRTVIRAPMRLIRLVRYRQAGDPIDAVFDRLLETDTRVLLAFSGDEPLAGELKDDGLFGRLDRWPNVSLRDLPGRDHTVRTIVAQTAVHELIDEELKTELARDIGSRSERGPSLTAIGSARPGGHRDDAQSRANEKLWVGTDQVKAYATRELRPVEVMLLVRYRDELSGRVLELGCGAGRLTGYLSELASAAYGIDISPRMVAYCRERYPRATFNVGDLRDVGALEIGTFDVIFASYNVIDVVGHAERGVVLDGIARALRPGGLLIVSSHNRATAPRRRLRDALAHRSAMGVAAAFVELPRWMINRRRLMPFERNEADYAILNDVSQDFSALHYYITRDGQERQLTEHGFEFVECLDLDGHLVAAGEMARGSTELHYVARTATNGPART